ncbi:acyl-CoA thioesterase [Granulicoccus phenolivorans]|uniref:acyl-CoA thioesterase n=1 Tax=Granulicoccus phenolivorans TaxID=266854 RepID=UPI0035712EB1
MCPLNFDDGTVRRFTEQERSWFAARALADGRPGFPLGRIRHRAIGAAAAHRHPLQVRWSDVDRYGHVNNTTYLEYFQEGRIQALLDTGMDMPGLRIMVARQDVEYHSQTEPRRRPFEVVSAVQSLGVTSSVVAQEMRDVETGTVKASGRTVQVLTRDGVPVRMPTLLRAAAQSWMLPAE